MGSFDLLTVNTPLSRSPTSTTYQGRPMVPVPVVTVITGTSYTNQRMQW